MTDRQEEMIYYEGYRRGKEQTMSEIILEKRYPHSRSEDITDAFMRGYVKGKADRPKGEWKVISKTINTTLVSCSECGKRFHIPNYCFKSERDRWKCCPICGADMRGDGNEI